MHSIHDKRLLYPKESLKHMSDVCQNISESIDNNYYRHIGYHQECHKRLTIHVSQLKSTAKIAITTPVQTPSSKILFPRNVFFEGNSKPRMEEKLTDLNILLVREVLCSIISGIT